MTNAILRIAKESTRQNKDAEAQQILNAVLNDLKRFQKQAEYEDDAALVVIKIKN